MNQGSETQKHEIVFSGVRSLKMFCKALTERLGI